MVILIGIWLGFVISVFLAVIVPAVVPAFRLTIGNFFVFLLGALVGTFTLSAYVADLLKNQAEHPDRQTNIQLILLSMIVGGLVGGTPLVWLKTRLQRKP